MIDRRKLITLNPSKHFDGSVPLFEFEFNSLGLNLYFKVYENGYVEVASEKFISIEVEPIQFVVNRLSGYMDQLQVLKRKFEIVEEKVSG